MRMHTQELNALNLAHTQSLTQAMALTVKNQIHGEKIRVRAMREALKGPSLKAVGLVVPTLMETLEGAITIGIRAKIKF